jgi:hypothetical protein
MQRRCLSHDPVEPGLSRPEGEDEREVGEVALRVRQRLGDHVEGGKRVVVLASPRQRKRVDRLSRRVVVATVEAPAVSVVGAREAVNRVGSPQLVNGGKKGGVQGPIRCVPEFRELVSSLIPVPGYPLSCRVNAPARTFQPDLFDEGRQLRDRPPSLVQVLDARQRVQHKRHPRVLEGRKDGGGT